MGSFLYIYTRYFLFEKVYKVTKFSFYEDICKSVFGYRKSETRG